MLFMCDGSVRIWLKICRFCLHFIGATNPVRFQRNQPLTLDPGFTKSGFVSPLTRQYGLILSINPCDRPRLTSDRSFSPCLQEKLHHKHFDFNIETRALFYFKYKNSKWRHRPGLTSPYHLQ